MENLLLLLIESLTSLAISIAVLQVLSRPLKDVLDRICPDEQAATFWLGYSRVMLLIAPLLLVLVTDMFAFFNDSIDSWRFSLVMALGGTLIALYMMGERLGQFITTPQNRRDAS